MVKTDEIIFPKYQNGDVIHFTVENIEDEGSEWKITLEDSEKIFSTTFRLYKSPKLPSFICPVPVVDYLNELETIHKDSVNTEYIADNYNLTVYGIGISVPTKTYDNLTRHYSFNNGTGWANHMKFSYPNGTVIFEIKETQDTNNDDTSPINKIWGYEVTLLIGFFSIGSIIFLRKIRKNFNLTN
ncbi:MAG: hypothetical protein GF329_12160 [Candidatus Lokiarchaeota archaeon]|nr:hypothetical protein [Candidatus Lokiarchaeota archaeon]